LEVVVVAAPSDPLSGGAADGDDRGAEEWRSAADKQLAERWVLDGVVHLRRGPVVPELIDASSDAAMLVVGSTGHALSAGLVTGSVSQHAARHAHCPVVVVRQSRSPDAGRIVVGIDGSEESDRALRFACERARCTGESVTGIHGYYLNTRLTNPDVGWSDADIPRQSRAADLVSETCARFAEEFPDVEIEAEAIAVRAGRVLVDASAVASLVVVGSRGRNAFAELMLGSVSQHVLHHAHCPVAVVRERGASIS
jgi:nucleotide-binding universal stress UspA family protein